MSKASALALVDQLRIEINALADVVVTPPPPPPPPPPSGRLRVAGSQLLNAAGAVVELHAVELMVGQDVKNRGYATLLSQLKNDLHANAVSPLFEGATYGALAEVKAFLDAATALGLYVGVNADHQANGRAWLNAPAMVTLLNGYTNVYLECEVETDQTTSSAQWATDAKALVAAVRAAGHLSVLKVGAPLGGRMVKHPLAQGAAVLAADPLHQIVFTFQCYWKSVTTGWQYSEDNGFVAGLAGAKAALGACAASGLVFIPGFDYQDDVGVTDVAALIAEARRLHLSHAYWVLYGDGMYPLNNLYSSWQLTPAVATSTAGLLATAWA